MRTEKHEVTYENFDAGTYKIVAKKINGGLRDIEVTHHGYSEKFTKGDFSDGIADLIYKLVKVYSLVEIEEKSD